jgi:hypothetical protein
LGVGDAKETDVGVQVIHRNQQNVGRSRRFGAREEDRQGQGRREQGGDFPALGESGKRFRSARFVCDLNLRACHYAGERYALAWFFHEVWVVASNLILRQIQ